MFFDCLIVLITRTYMYHYIWRCQKLNLKGKLVLNVNDFGCLDWNGQIRNFQGRMPFRLL